MLYTDGNSWIFCYNLQLFRAANLLLIIFIHIDTTLDLKKTTRCLNNEQILITVCWSFLKEK